MKPALVLGLALAAGAMAADQAENELFVAPQGKLAELAKKYPGMIMYDEVADDEFYRGAPPRENYKSDSEWWKATRNYRAPREKAAEHVAYDDDELQILNSNDGIRRFYTTYYDIETGTWKVAPGQYTINLDDNDELFARPLGPLIIGADDDELIAINQPQKKPFEESKHAILCRNSPNHPFCGGSHYQIKKPFEESKMTQKYKEFLRNQRLEADDEELFYVPGMRIQDLARDDDDDELFKGLPSKQNFKSYEEWASFLKKMDEAADDELLAFANIPKYVQMDEVADDELGFRPNLPPPQFQFDDADDELVYLGQLIKDGGYIPRPYFDDEFRAEKPSHGKAQEKAHMKTEGPKNKKKFRPVADERPAYQDYIL